MDSGGEIYSADCYLKAIQSVRRRDLLKQFSGQGYIQTDRCWRKIVIGFEFCYTLISIENSTVPYRTLTYSQFDKFVLTDKAHLFKYGLLIERGIPFS